MAEFTVREVIDGDSFKFKMAGNGIKGAEMLSVLLDIILQKRESLDTKKRSRNSKG